VTQTIIDPNTGKERTAKDLRITSHAIHDENGDVQAVKCVEFTVIGTNREWQHWAPFDEFMACNQHVDL
jgi:hypothetical protein